MELEDSLNLLFSFVARYTSTCFHLVYPITARLDKFIHQNWETIFPVHEDNREHGTA